MMIKQLLLLGLVAGAFVATRAAGCTEDNCKLPDCKCASTEIPGNLKVDQVPQFVLFTFDDAVRADNYGYYKDTFYGKKNPDGCGVGTTYFVSHEYSDYSKVNDLWANGHEIALHSISHSSLTTYWQTISKEDLRKEFGGERDLVSHFANISIDDIQGIRLPFLQLSGNNSFEVIKETGMTYDCSWPTLNYRKPGLWPYTLDYRSDQDCPVGPCPTASIPGVWVVPMIDWVDLENSVCAMVDSCRIIPEKEDELLDWYISNFNTSYYGNRAPFGFYVHAAWFLTNEAHYKAYQRFVDYLQEKEDVYLVTAQGVLDWMKNPVPIGSDDWPECVERPKDACNAPQTCKLNKLDEGERYMTICTDCPKDYPWIDNPLGN